MSLWKEVDISSFNKLTQEEKSIYIKAIQNEGNITPELKEIVIKNGGYLDGLEYRIKSPSSVFEKVYLRPKSTPILEIHDIVRYTTPLFLLKKSISCLVHECGANARDRFF